MPRKSHLPGFPAALFRSLIPYAERDEVLGDLAAEHAERAAAEGRLAARIWLWRQLFGSLPALARRSWWRGWTGFEPRAANRMQPGGFILESWIVDLRYSTRRLVSRPTYLLLAVLTLALGAGGTAAIFSVVRTLLLDPLPIARESEVGVFWMPGYWNEAEFLHLRPDFQGFRRVAAIRNQDLTLELDGQSMRLLHATVSSAELFEVLGTGAFLGRTFKPGEDLTGAEPVAVLSYGLWQELGGDASILGRPVRIGGIPRTVVGVMPAGFWFPDPETRVWTTTPLSSENRAGNYALVGRAAPGVRIESMEGQLGAIAASLKPTFEYLREFDKTASPSITPLREHLVGKVRPSLLATLAAMALILLMACVNVAALMLGQVAGRNVELAVRVALGAGRKRLLQQLFIESLLIGALAGIVGALIAAGGFRVLVGALPLGALAETATLDWTLFWGAIVVALVAAALIAVIPGIVLWRGNLQGSIATARTAGVSGRGGRLDGGLVVAQIALAVLLAAGAGLLLRSVAKLRAIDPGVQVEGVAVIDATMPTQLTFDERRRATLEVLPALQALPNVRAVAATQKLPLRGRGDDWGLEVVGRPDLEESTTFFRIVTPDYFKALGVPIRRGRGFLPSDRTGTERVVVINEALAAKYFQGEDPVGRLISTGFDDRGERIIGVVGNVAETNLVEMGVPARYMLYEQVPYTSHQVAYVLSAANPEDVPRLLQAGRSVLQREGRRLAIEGTVTMESVFEEAIGAPRQIATLLSLLAGLALLLGAVGVYGMISHFVTRRMREYGIRIALGLPPARVVSQVMTRGVVLVVLGSAVGIAAALLLTRLLASLLYGVGATDPQALAGAVLALLLVGALAALSPALRASRTDPASVLRNQ
ncbi:MAG TPA: ADOP family duplicated permease [Thermoanaerobaculia bacterium]|jgi:predicted permease|nr:ADOP family duplicated permease [Thermoanaerobaculia bacterium]